VTGAPAPRRESASVSAAVSAASEIVGESMRGHGDKAPIRIGISYRAVQFV
jgi:hypothetical protein